MRNSTKHSFFRKTAQVLFLCLLWLGLSSFGKMDVEDIFDIVLGGGSGGQGTSSGGGTVNAGIDFTANSRNDAGQNYQINVRNQSGKALNAWSLTIPVQNGKYSNSNLPSFWNCTGYFSGGSMVFNSDYSSGNVKNGETNTLAGFWALHDSLDLQKAYFQMTFADGTSYRGYCYGQNSGGTASTQKPSAQTVFVDFSPSNYNDAGQNYQINVKNTDKKAVNEWTVSVPVLNQKYNGNNLPSFWNCSAAYQNGSVVLKSSAYSGKVEKGATNSQAGLWALHKGLDFDRATFSVKFADGTTYSGSCSGLAASSSGTTGGQTAQTPPGTSQSTQGVKAYMELYASGNNDWGQNYQISIQNQSGKTIRAWTLTAPVLGGKYNAQTLPSFWNCAASYSNNTVVFKSDSNSGNIQSGKTYSDAGIWALHNALDFSKAYYQFTFADGSTYTGNISGFASAGGNSGTGGGSSAGSGNAGGSSGASGGISAVTLPAPTVASGSFANHGKLSVQGTKIVDKKGNSFILRGVSTHGINWDCGEPFVNKSAFAELNDNWGVNAVRLAMYTAEYNGYCSGGNQAELRALVERGVAAATELGMYVIIDWHILNDKNPLTNKESAKEFFGYMAQRYANYSNVLFEICNEPNGGTSWNDVKTYAEEIIPVIRKYSKDALIIVGTPNWCQDVDVASKSPLKGYSNIVYSVHFYAATHKDSYRRKVQTALKAGLPILCSEFGLSPASGDGQLDYDSCKEWLDMFDQNGISYFCWSFSNKGESSALLKSGVKSWSANDRSAAGNWLVQQYVQRNK